MRSLMYCGGYDSHLYSVHLNTQTFISPHKKAQYIESVLNFLEELIYSSYHGQIEFFVRTARNFWNYTGGRKSKFY